MRNRAVLQNRFLFLIANMLLYCNLSNAQPTYTLPDTSGFGRLLSHTMGLFGTSTPTQKKKVKVLVYGQSLAKQDWWLDTKAYLQATYPNADLEMINPCIGAYASNLLIKTLNMDAITYYPDLMIIHDFAGDTITYEAIFDSMRRVTTSEVALCTDRVSDTVVVKDYMRWGGVQYYPENWKDARGPNGIYKADGAWDNWMSLRKSPLIASIYKCEIVQTHLEWIRYIQLNHLTPSQLLIADMTHFNDWGNYLFSAITKPHLVYKNYPLDEDGLVTTFEIGKDVDFVNGVLQLSFAGNKVEFVGADPGTSKDSAAIKLDNKLPSYYQGCYSYTRPNLGVGTDWPWTAGTFCRLQHTKPWILESWTLTFTSVTRNASNLVTSVAFTVSGSKTGADGSGTSDALFTSTSGRVVIDPSDWVFKQLSDAAMHNSYQTNGTVKWNIIPLFKDTYVPPAVADATKETLTNIAQHFPVGDHTITVTASNNTGIPLKAIKIYRPSYGRPATALTLSLDKNSLNINNTNGSNGNVVLTSNTNWSMTGVPSWLTVNKTFGLNGTTLTFTANSANTGTARSATIQIRTSNVALKTLTVTQNGASVLNTEDFDQAVKLFPIPANNQITIELPELSTSGSIEVFNMLGQSIKMIRSNGETTLNIDISDLNDGYYFAKIRIGENSTIKNFSIAR